MHKLWVVFFCYAIFTATGLRAQQLTRIVYCVDTNKCSSCYSEINLGWRLVPPALSSLIEISVGLDNDRNYKEGYCYLLRGDSVAYSYRVGSSDGFARAYRFLDSLLLVSAPVVLPPRERQWAIASKENGPGEIERLGFNRFQWTGRKETIIFDSSGIVISRFRYAPKVSPTVLEFATGVFVSDSIFALLIKRNRSVVDTFIYNKEIPLYKDWYQELSFIHAESGKIVHKILWDSINFSFILPDFNDSRVGLVARTRLSDSSAFFKLEWISSDGNRSDVVADASMNRCLNFRVFGSILFGVDSVGLSRFEGGKKVFRRPWSFFPHGTNPEIVDVSDNAVTLQWVERGKKWLSKYNFDGQRLTAPSGFNTNISMFELSGNRKLFLDVSHGNLVGYTSNS